MNIGTILFFHDLNPVVQFQNPHDFSILRGHCFLPFFDMIKYKPDRAFATFSKLQIHTPGSDQMYSGVQQLPMCTQNSLNCSACPKTKIFETKYKQSIDNHNFQAQGGKNDQKLMYIKIYKCYLKTCR